MSHFHEGFSQVHCMDSHVLFFFDPLSSIRQYIHLDFCTRTRSSGMSTTYFVHLRLGLFLRTLVIITYDTKNSYRSYATSINVYVPSNVVCRKLLGLFTVLWIRNDLERIWILLFRAGKLNYWQIIPSVRNGTAAIFSSISEIILGLKTNWTISKENLQKLYIFSCQKVRTGSGSTTLHV
jgi:hypothetical protein